MIRDTRPIPFTPYASAEQEQLPKLNFTDEFALCAEHHRDNIYKITPYKWEQSLQSCHGTVWRYVMPHLLRLLVMHEKAYPVVSSPVNISLNANRWNCSYWDHLSTTKLNFRQTTTRNTSRCSWLNAISRTKHWSHFLSIVPLSSLDQPVTGRYVILQVLHTKSLNICELEVYGGT